MGLKWIKDGKFKELADDELKELSAEDLATYTSAKMKAEIDSFKEQTLQAQKDLVKDTITTAQFEAKLEELTKALEGKISNGDSTSEIKEIVEGQSAIIEALKKQGKELKSLQEGNVINKDLTVNKGLLRTIVEEHLEKSGVIGDEVENENGVKVRPVNLNANHNLNNTAQKQVHDLRVLSKRYSARKAGENIFIGGTGTQAVFNQAINRTSIGEIAPPLTANEHALDIFNAQNVSGSLMTLLVYENLEDNSELVAEGAAPTLDSRIELTSKDFKVFDFSATATISKNLLQDSAEVVEELVTQLADGIKTTLDNNLFVTGGDNNVTPWGILNDSQSCELFNPLLFTGTSPQANIISVIGKAKLQARLNDWMTDMTILNPKEWDAIEDLKDQADNSIKDNRLAVNALGEVIAVKGMTKHQTTKMPENTLLVCQSMLQVIGLRQDIATSFGYNSDDFKKRKVSWLMDMRAGYGQKAKESSIYVDDISSAIEVLKESAAESITRINGYAVASNASPLTVATLVNTKATDVIEANLAEYKVAIAAEAGIADLAALQAIIDVVNAA